MLLSYIQDIVIYSYVHLCIGLHTYARIGLYRPIPVYHLGLYTHVGLYNRPNIRVYDPVGGPIPADLWR